MRTSDFNLLQNLVKELTKDSNPTLLKDEKLITEIREKTGFYDVYLVEKDFDFEGELDISKYYDPTKPNESDLQVPTSLLYPNIPLSRYELVGVENYQGQEKLESFEYEYYHILKYSGQERTKKGLKGFCQVYVYINEK